ncbi:MAG: hypothetical protein M3Y41_20105, partial [Pseudomonadota bacterium]|nr:hypothetical protein [Pseudomonadota bacterium]
MLERPFSFAWVRQRRATRVAPQATLPRQAQALPALSAGLLQTSGMPHLASMTGFARAEGSVGSTTWVWELRSVNGRGLDLRLRLP